MDVQIFQFIVEIIGVSPLTDFFFRLPEPLREDILLFLLFNILPQQRIHVAHGNIVLAGRVFEIIRDFRPESPDCQRPAECIGAAVVKRVKNQKKRRYFQVVLFDIANEILGRQFRAFSVNLLLFVQGEISENVDF